MVGLFRGVVALPVTTDGTNANDLLESGEVDVTQLELDEEVAVSDPTAAFSVATDQPILFQPTPAGAVRAQALAALAASRPAKPKGATSVALGAAVATLLVVSGAAAYDGKVPTPWSFNPDQHVYFVPDGYEDTFRAQFPDTGQLSGDFFTGELAHPFRIVVFEDVLGGVKGLQGAVKRTRSNWMSGDRYRMDADTDTIIGLAMRQKLVATKPGTDWEHGLDFRGSRLTANEKTNFVPYAKAGKIIPGLMHLLRETDKFYTEGVRDKKKALADLIRRCDALGKHLGEIPGAFSEAGTLASYLGEAHGAMAGNRVLPIHHSLQLLSITQQRLAEQFRITESELERAGLTATATPPTPMSGTEKALIAAALLALALGLSIAIRQLVLASRRKEAYEVIDGLLGQLDSAAKQLKALMVRFNRSTTVTDESIKGQETEKLFEELEPLVNRLHTGIFELRHSLQVTRRRVRLAGAKKLDTAKRSWRDPLHVTMTQTDGLPTLFMMAMDDWTLRPPEFVETLEADVARAATLGDKLLAAMMFVSEPAEEAFLADTIDDLQSKLTQAGVSTKYLRGHPLYQARLNTWKTLDELRESDPVAYHTTLSAYWKMDEAQKVFVEDVLLRGLDAANDAQAEYEAEEYDGPGVIKITEEIDPLPKGREANVKITDFLRRLKRPTDEQIGESKWFGTLSAVVVELYQEALRRKRDIKQQQRDIVNDLEDAEEAKTDFEELSLNGKTVYPDEFDPFAKAREGNGKLLALRELAKGPTTSPEFHMAAEQVWDAYEQAERRIGKINQAIKSAAASIVSSESEVENAARDVDRLLTEITEVRDFHAVESLSGPRGQLASATELLRQARESLTRAKLYLQQNRHVDAVEAAETAQDKIEEADTFLETASDEVNRLEGLRRKFNKKLEAVQERRRHLVRMLPESNFDLDLSPATVFAGPDAQLSSTLHVVGYEAALEALDEVDEALTEANDAAHEAYREAEEAAADLAAAALLVAAAAVKVATEAGVGVVDLLDVAEEGVDPAESAVDAGLGAVFGEAEVDDDDVGGSGWDSEAEEDDDIGGSGWGEDD